MNRFAIVFVLMLASLRAGAATWCCERQGARLEYERTSPDGDFVWKHTMRITAVKRDSHQSRVTSVSSFTKKDGSPYYRANVTEIMTVDLLSQELSIDMTSAMAAYIKARTGMEARTVGKSVAKMPAVLVAGDTLPAISATCMVGPLKCSMNTFKRRVLRNESIDTPAGRFDCIVIQECRDEETPVPGLSRHITTLSWYTPGIGYVRHDTYDSKGRLKTTERLTAIK